MSKLSNPQIVIILSGKRKSGKDYVAKILSKIIKNLVIIRIAGPIKKEYAKMHNLDYEILLSDSIYKEKYRFDMVKWSESIRIADPDYFLRLSIVENNAFEFPIWLLTDARRESDMEYFQNEPQFKDIKLITLKIKASEECRKNRGYVYTKSIDDAETECGLDNYNKWNYELNNENLSEDQIIKELQFIVNECKIVE